MPMPRVRAVVLNYNGGDHVGRCLRALRATDWDRDRFEIVVVDNASADGSDALIESSFPEVDLRRSPTNAGFPANNLALADLDDVDYVALVNNDAFVEPDWLAPLVEQLESEPGLGAACPRIVFADQFAVLDIAAPAMVPGGGDPRTLGVRLHGATVDGEPVLGRVGGRAVYPIEVDADGEPFRWTADRGVLALPIGAGQGPWKVELDFAAPIEGPLTLRAGAAHEGVDSRPGTRQRVTITVDGPPVDVVNNAGSVVLRDGSGADRGFHELDGDAFERPADVFAWCGAGVLLRSAYLADVGLFDERFFMYYEDTDLSWRGQILGWRYAYVPGSRVRHVHAATSVEGSVMFRHFVERNRLLMLAKDAPAALAIRAPLRFLTATAAYARRDVAAPLVSGRRPDTTVVRARLRSFGGYCRLLPAMIRDRRSLRSGASTSDTELGARLVDSPLVRAP